MSYWAHSHGKAYRASFDTVWQKDRFCLQMQQITSALHLSLKFILFSVHLAHCGIHINFLVLLLLVRDVMEDMWWYRPYIFWITTYALCSYNVYSLMLTLDYSRTLCFFMNTTLLLVIHSLAKITLQSLEKISIQFSSAVRHLGNVKITSNTNYL